MTRLSVNINKIATLRNARGHDEPILVQFATRLIELGVKSLTIHPRPDERHIKHQDVYDLHRLLSKQPVEFNIEGYPSAEFLQLMEEIRPTQCTLVPDPPNVLTSNAGWNLHASEKQLQPILNRLRELNIRRSLFVDPFVADKKEFVALKNLNPARVELFTEAYAKAYATSQRDRVTRVYSEYALKVSELGIELNAGHDLDQNNLKHLIQQIPQIKEVSIGHALICEALYQGIDQTIQAYHRLLGY